MKIHIKKITVIFVFVLFMFPILVNAEQVNSDIFLGKFFNKTLDSLTFKPNPNIHMFETIPGNFGNTIIFNPLGNLKPIGSLNLIQIPANILLNFSNFVFEEVSK